MTGPVNLLKGDCRLVLPTLEANSVHAVVCDPPYGLEFMGKDWDNGVPGVHFWTEIIRVARPGCHLLAFGGTRTFHRLACAIEDAGWEMRDTLMWVYGSGFPKSLDVSKAIDKEAGAKRTRTTFKPLRSKDGKHEGFKRPWMDDPDSNAYWDSLPETEAAKQWEGWGTALKPAWEPIILARKPIEGTVAENVQKWGTGALNIEACRVPTNGDVRSGGFGLGKRPWQTGDVGGNTQKVQELGRWPANFIHDGSQEVLDLFPECKSGQPCGVQNTEGGYGKNYGSIPVTGFGDSGSAARFFYCAKASRQDRDEGCEGMDLKPSYMVENGGKGYENSDGANRNPRTTTHRNNHPTVKPTALMRYLCRLVTPPNGVILDPFMGSGSTGKAAVMEGFSFIGIELDEGYMEIAEKRINHQTT